MTRGVTQEQGRYRASSLLPMRDDSSLSTQAAPGPRVWMLVRNSFTHDSRVEKEASSLGRAGFGVTVFADAAPGLRRIESRPDYRVVRIERPLARLPVIRFLAGELVRARVLSRAGPDILHAHDSNALLPVWLAASRNRRPFVYDAHDLWLERPRRERSRVYHWANQAWYRLLERALVPRASGWITVSAPIAAHLERRYRLSHVEVVENYPPKSQVTGHKTLSLRTLQGGDAIPENMPIVLYLGGLMGDRGIGALVEAMTDVPDAHLVLLGEGPQAGALMRLADSLGIGRKVHRLGPVPGEEVVAYARSADVGVSPMTPSGLNNRYSLPNKLFQYMAAGLPVVVGDLPEVRAVVESSGAGYAVDTRSPPAIAAAIRKALSDPASSEMGARGRQAVVQRFNWETGASHLIALYERIAASWQRR